MSPPTQYRLSGRQVYRLKKTVIHSGHWVTVVHSRHRVTVVHSGHWVSGVN